MNKKTLSDIDYLLWNIAVNDDRKAFKELFQVYYTPLCIYAKRFIDEQETREDIVQDVFFYIWEKRKAIDINTSAKSYLVTSVRNHCLNVIRKNNFHEDYQKKMMEKESFDDNIHDLLTLKELTELLEKTLAKLPPEYRLAFEMSRMEGKSTSEIAETMGISIRTVERYRLRATEILRSELKDYLPLLTLFFIP